MINSLTSNPKSTFFITDGILSASDTPGFSYFLFGVCQSALDNFSAVQKFFENRNEVQVYVALSKIISQALA
jgi:hypothetical protein